MIAVHIQLFRGAGHQVLAAGNLAHQVGHASADRGVVALGAHAGVAGVAGAHTEAAGVILAHPCEECVLVTRILLRGVAVRPARRAEHVRLVHELGRVNRHAVFFAQAENLFGFARVPGLFGLVQAVAVGNRDQQLGADRFAEIQHTDPLLPGQAVLVAFGGDAGAVKIVVGFGRPGAGNPHPGRPERTGQGAQLDVVQVNRRKHLHEFGHIPHQVFDRRERLGAGNLARGILFPEGAAGDFGHFHVVGHQPFVHLAQHRQGTEGEFDSL